MYELDRTPPVILTNFSRFFSVCFLSLSLLTVNSSSLMATAVMDIDAENAIAARIKDVIDNWVGSRSWMTDDRIVLIDTETTGLAYTDRIVQLSMYEVIDGDVTGRTFNSYFNPDMRSSSRAYKAHRLGYDFLSRQPKFADRFDEIKAFIGDSLLVGHNVSFDIAKVIAEVERIPGASLAVMSKDTMGMAKRDDRRRVLGEHNHDTSPIISPPPKYKSGHYKTPAERAARQQELEDRRFDADYRNDTRMIAGLQANSTAEARDERAARRARQRSSDQAGLDDRYDTAETSGYSLSAVAKRACTNASRALAAHGHNLKDLSRRAGIPANRIGKPHDAFYDVGTLVGVADSMKSGFELVQPLRLFTDDSESSETEDQPLSPDANAENIPPVIEHSDSDLEPTAAIMPAAAAEAAAAATASSTQGWTAWFLSFSPLRL